ncbi:hypothetical protein DFR58_101103 [Anaerobacterium chartisolvens]|uniref:Uncharacterized protein n=1 Tax=Anaerobacterium chartisolvens TaxID=1297424 RepID=A0A369BHL7_9FIRM|nr:hypothetical protein [Anaerobacterium chartisolvens]RCX20901.1 hypothetical protein DFR58_101103 [Anaerobacterium chartisolvens]
MKKRNCRKTEAERQAHETAVKLRKMTDGQICEFINGTFDSGVQEGIRQSSKKASATVDTAVHDAAIAAKKYEYEDMMLRIKDIKGIGAATIAKITEAFRDKSGKRENGSGIIKGEM